MRLKPKNLGSTIVGLWQVFYSVPIRVLWWF